MKTFLRNNISRTVWLLSFVSLFTDTASEALYPVMPLYLKSVGFSIVWIGVLEGVAEFVAGLSKGYFGKWSDLSGKRVPFVQAGYALSAVCKPLMVAFTAPLWIFFVRATERLGKGIRSAARDALLSDEATPENKATVFGFHRSMDTVGAVLGPSLALVYLYFYPQAYQTLFLLAFLPGLAAIALTFLLKDKTNTLQTQRTSNKISFWVSFTYFRDAPVAYKKLTAGLIGFMLFNSSDLFLLLKLKETGIDDTTVIGIYIFYNLVFAIVSFPIGIMADKIGLKYVLLTGLLLFAVVYAGMAFTQGFYGFIFLFFLYGVYAAATEGIAKAWLSNLVYKKDVATALGAYSSFQSIVALLASSLMGALWVGFGPKAAFLIAAAGVLSAGIFIGTLPFSRK